MHEPTLVIVSGPAATGKTTLAKRLGEMTSLPVICKDDIKESLFDSLGYDTPEWAEKLEIATYDLLFQQAETILKTAQSLIIESDVTPLFNEARINELQSRYKPRTIQLACRTDGSVLIERFKARMNSGTQHPGHYEAYYLENSQEFRDSLQLGYSHTLNLEGEVIAVDTTNFEDIDYQSLSTKILA